MVLCSVVQVLRLYQRRDTGWSFDSASETNVFLFDSRLMSGWETPQGGGGGGGKEGGFDRLSLTYPTGFWCCAVRCPNFHMA